MSNDNKDELYHYGVLGMKWGKRKSALNRQNASDYNCKGLTVSQASRQAKKDAAAAKKEAKAEKKAAKANMSSKDKLKKAVSKGKKIIARAAVLSLADDVFYGGKVKKTTGAVIKQVGRKATEAWMYKHGAISVTWLD